MCRNVCTTAKANKPTSVDTHRLLLWPSLQTLNRFVLDSMSDVLFTQIALFRRFIALCVDSMTDMEAAAALISNNLEINSSHCTAFAAAGASSRCAWIA
mgnify:CR=1 FL=1